LLKKFCLVLLLSFSFSSHIFSQDDPNILSQNDPDILSQNDPDILSQDDPNILSQNDPNILSQNDPDILSQDNPDADREEQSLFDRTLFNDINTASYYELISWSRELGLDDKGNTDLLKNQLYSHYGIDPENTSQEKPDNATIVKIVSADSTEYYTVEEIDEEYVRISGRVKLIVKQPAKNITHTIEADTVIFNQSINSMTARGNILYIKNENGKLEEYTGDNFTFNVQSWKGVILKGDFKKTQEVGQSEIEFIFSGESIQKGEGDVVVLEDGSISSCDEEDKHYQIKAKKIWILGPDEWAILSGFLYVGNVPVLYIPFYHLPGNDMFFNPAIGTDTRKGYFIQTTSYLLGKKDNAEEDDSFFINIADSDETYRLVPEGLYLFKEKGDVSESSSDYIKYKLDYYSRLGGYTALEGSIAQLWKFKALSFDVGIGVTRSIKSPESGINDFYSNYFSENNYDAEWNSSYLFGATLPFRWGLSFQFTFLKFRADFTYLTDPWFYSDFSSREENFDWLNYLLAQTTFDEDEDVNTTSEGSFQWSVNGMLNIPNQWAGNYINTFSFNPVKFNIQWNTMANELYDSDHDYRPYDPGREFFYPDNMTIPQTTLNLAGILLDYSTKESFGVTGKEDSALQDENLRSPWNRSEDYSEGEKKSSDITGLKKPDTLNDLSIKLDKELFSTKISYSLSGYFNYISYTDSENWAQPDDIDFSSLKSIFTNNNTANLNYSLNFFNRIFVLSGKNSFVTNYLDYLGDISSDDESREKEYEKLRWQNDLNFKIFPLMTVPFFSKSNVSYQFNTYLFKREYNNTLEIAEDKWIEWDEDYITDHRTALNLDFTIPLLTAKVSFDSTLPPREIEQSIIPGFSISFFNWTNSVNTKAVFKEDEWEMEPLNFSSVFTPTDKISISEQLIYSFEEDTLTSSISRVQLWGLSATFNMSYANDYHWDKDMQLLDYDKDEDGIAIKKFLPSSVALAYNYKFESPLLWKNRIKMDFSINTTFSMNLQQYNLSSLNFDFSYNLQIHEFLDLKFSLSTSNNHMFLYFPSLREYYGITDDYSFFEDFFKSINFFSSNQQDRYDSFFNMNSLNISLVHKLHDWDLEMGYIGKPLIEPNDSGGSSTKWDSTLSILVRWNPIEKIKIKVDRIDEEWNADTEFE